jgi:hypothetical protein
VEYQARAAALLGFDLEFTQWFYTVEAEPWMSFLYLLVVPLYVAGSFFAFSAVSAANRLKPRAENRSTNLKVFYVAFLYVGTALWWILIHQETIPSAWTRWAAMATLFGATGVMATLSAFFAAEEPVHALPEALRRRARWLLFQPLRPGSVNGFWFTLIVNAVLLAPSVVLASRFMTAFTGTGVSFALPLVGLALTILSFLFLTGSMGLFLSSLFRNERLRMGLQSAFASFLLFAPLVAYAVLHRFKELPFVSFADPGLLSPVVAFGSLTTGFFETVFPAAKDVVPVSVFPFEARMGGLAAPAFVPAVAFDLVFGALLLALGWRRLRRAAGEQESAGEGGGGAGAATAGDEAPHAEAERGSKE